MKEIEEKARKELTTVYTKYLEVKDKDLISDEAERIYCEYQSASTMLPEEINLAVGKLFSLFQPEVGIKVTTYDEAEQIIIDLKQ